MSLCDYCLCAKRGELTFTAAAAAPQTPSDDQTDGISRRRGLALCCRGNSALSRWRKRTSILRWESVTTGVRICEFRSSPPTMTQPSPTDLKWLA